VYSVRPRAGATVSAPVTWQEIEAGVRIEDFDLFSVPARVARVGDLWLPMAEPDGRFELRSLLREE
jgi:bifunctional non-homologous end joining protein LigD